MADALLAAWLPDYHGQYYGPSGSLTSQLDDLGPNFVEAHRGLVVPSYVSIDSVADLDAAGDDFGFNIIAIDPGADVVKITQAAADDDTYGLGNWAIESHTPGSGAFTKVTTAVNAQTDVVFTGWKPHWIFGKHDMKLLDDPLGIYGDAQDIHTVTRQGLADTNPGAHTFFNEFGWTNLNFQEVMLSIEEGATPEQAARDYIEANRADVEANRADIEAQLPPDGPYFQ